MAYNNNEWYRTPWYPQMYEPLHFNRGQTIYGVPPQRRYYSSQPITYYHHQPPPEASATVRPMGHAENGSPETIDLEVQEPSVDNAITQPHQQLMTPQRHPFATPDQQHYRALWPNPQTTYPAPHYPPPVSLPVPGAPGWFHRMPPPSQQQYPFNSGINSLIKCCKCGINLDYDQMEEHISLRHLRWQPYQCVHCSDTFYATAKRLQEHLDVAHMGQAARILYMNEPEDKRKKALLADLLYRSTQPTATPTQPISAPISATNEDLPATLVPAQPEPLSTESDLEPLPLKAEMVATEEQFPVAFQNSNVAATGHSDTEIDNSWQPPMPLPPRLPSAVDDMIADQIKPSKSNLIRAHSVSEVTLTSISEGKRTALSNHNDTTPFEMPILPVMNSDNEEEDRQMTDGRVSTSPEPEQSFVFTSSIAITASTPKRSSIVRPKRPSVPDVAEIIDSVISQAKEATKTPHKDKEKKIKSKKNNEILQTKAEKRSQTKRSELKDQAKTKSLSEVSAEKPDFCKKCRKTTRGHPTSHLYQQHLKKDTVKCPYCPFGTYCSVATVKKHIESVHKGRPIVVEDCRKDFNETIEALRRECFNVAEQRRQK